MIAQSITVAKVNTLSWVESMNKFRKNQESPKKFEYVTQELGLKGHQRIKYRWRCKHHYRQLGSNPLILIQEARRDVVVIIGI